MCMGRSTTDTILVCVYVTAIVTCIFPCINWTYLYVNTYQRKCCAFMFTCYVCIRTHILDIHTHKDKHAHLLDKFSIQFILSQGTGGNKRSSSHHISHSDRKVNLNRCGKELARKLARGGHFFDGIDVDCNNVRDNNFSNYRPELVLVWCATC